MIVFSELQTEQPKTPIIEENNAANSRFFYNCTQALYAQYVDLLPVGEPGVLYQTDYAKDDNNHNDRGICTLSLGVSNAGPYRFAWQLVESQDSGRTVTQVKLNNEDGSSQQFKFNIQGSRIAWDEIEMHQAILKIGAVIVTSDLPYQAKKLRDTMDIAREELVKFEQKQQDDQLLGDKKYQEEYENKLKRIQKIGFSVTQQFNVTETLMLPLVYRGYNLKTAR